MRILIAAIVILFVASLFCASAFPENPYIYRLNHASDARAMPARSGYRYPVELEPSCGWWGHCNGWASLVPMDSPLDMAMATIRLRLNLWVGVYYMRGSAYSFAW